MSFLNHALVLAEQGFHVFPLRPNSKLPLIDDYPNRATMDPEQIKKWWLDPILETERPYNIGISTTRWGSHGSLIVVDVDNKGKKRGDEEALKLELEGKELPVTFTQVTPSGGRHLVYWHPEPVKQGTDVLAKGLDIRSRGGYIAAVGSVIDGKEYTAEIKSVSLCDAPKWVVETCGRIIEKEEVQVKIENIDPARAFERAKFYLENEAPIAIEGEGGDETTYKVAARVKDFGVELHSCVMLMDQFWNHLCSPPWSPTDLESKVKNAYRYGNQAPGSAAPEAQFQPVGDEKIENFLATMNKEYALVYLEGSHFILHETIDEKGKPKRVFLTEVSFKRKFSPYLLENGNTYAEEWLDWKHRREYKGVCFAPEREPRHGYYNLWRGFTCSPVAYESATAEARKGLDMFLTHARDNVCRGDSALFKWLMGYFAHMVQRPWERPLTTLVLRGGKGTGKNALIDRVGNLLGSGHYLVAHDGRYLTSNFNAHFDSCLCLVLDEAFWSGNKDAEGKLKGLTTAPEILIERKGKEPYMVDNLVRLIVIGNEEWLVPASSDERRYAVLDVGDGKKQNRKFFHDMRVLIDEKGGNQVLLDYLKNYDLSDVDVNGAPKTEALLEQKINSLEPFHQWWFECLMTGQIAYSDFGNGWPVDIDKNRFRQAFLRYYKERNIRSRIPVERILGKMFKEALPSVDLAKKRREGSELINVYRLPILEDARREWEQYIGQKVNWE